MVMLLVLVLWYIHIPSKAKESQRVEKVVVESCDTKSMGWRGISNCWGF